MPSALADTCSPVGGNGGGSTIVMVSVAVPLVAVITMFGKAAPLDEYRVVETWPEASVTPLADVVRVGKAVKLPRLPGSVVIEKLTVAAAAGTPPSYAIAVMAVLAPAEMSVGL